VAVTDIRGDSMGSPKLGDYCTFVSGTGFPIEFQGKTNGDFPFIKVSDMKSVGNELRIWSSNNWIDNNEIGKFKNGLVPANSIVFAKIGLAVEKNRIRITTVPTIIDNNMMAAIPKENVSIGKLHAILSSIDFSSWILGAALPFLRRTDLANIDLSYIDMEYLESICFEYEKLIQTQDSENFKTVLMDELCISSISKSLEDASTTKMKGSLVKLSDLVDLTKKSIDPSKFKNELFNHYSLPDFDLNKKPSLSYGGEIQSNKFLISKDCILLSKLNPKIPRIWLVDLLENQRSICSTEFLPFSVKERIPISFIYYLFHTKEFKWMMLSFATGTTNSHQRINPNDILNFSLHLPPDQIISKFDNIGRSALEQRAISTQLQNRAQKIMKILMSKILVKEINL
jgi:type I restriction enzyme, S subunit